MQPGITPRCPTDPSLPYDAILRFGVSSLLPPYTQGPTSPSIFHSHIRRIFSLGSYHQLRTTLTHFPALS